MKDVVCFILAGGKGERLFPLTKSRPKPLLPYGGIFRLIDFPLSNCLNSGLHKVFIIGQYLSYHLLDYLNKYWVKENNIKYITPQQGREIGCFKGTADAIYQNLELIQEINPSYILILASDHIYRMDYRDFLMAHIEKEAELSIGVVEVPKEEAYRFGILETSLNGRVINFLEKPRYIMAKKRCLASMGIYIFNTDVLIKILYEDAHNLYSTHDFGKDIIPSMIKKYKVWTYNLDSYWRDVGTIDAYYEANMELLREEPPFNLYDISWPINTYLGQLPPANVFSLTLNSLISPGCNIKGQVESSILGPGVFVEEGTRVSDSLLLEGVKIGKYCRIHRAIIDRGVEIENGKKILGYPIFVVSEKKVEKKMPIFIREIRDKKLAKIG